MSFVVMECKGAEIAFECQGLSIGDIPIEIIPISHPV